MVSESRFRSEALGESPDKKARGPELTEKDIADVAREFGLDSDKTSGLLLKGLGLLVTPRVVSPYATARPERVSAPTLAERPFELSAGKRGPKEFRMYFDKKRFLETIGRSSVDERENIEVIFKRGDIDSEIYINQRVGDLTSEDDPTMIALDFDNGGVPLVQDRFRYGIYTTCDELCAILPFESSVVDVEASGRAAAACFDEGAYFRGLSTDRKQREEESAALEADMTMIADIVSDTDARLGIPSGIDKNLTLIMSAEGFTAAAVHRMDRAGVAHRTLLFSRNDVEGPDASRLPENSRSRIRHEYLHLVDDMLGKGGGYFSEEIGRAIVRTVAEQLYPGQDIPLDENGVTVTWPDRGRDNRIEELFSERRFLVDSGSDSGGLPGHPSDNVRELFVSIMNCYLDPRFEASVRRMSSKGAEVASLYRGVVRMVNERVSELGRIKY